MRLGRRIRRGEKSRNLYAMKMAAVLMTVLMFCLFSFFSGEREEGEREGKKRLHYQDTASANDRVRKVLSQVSLDKSGEAPPPCLFLITRAGMPARLRSQADVS